MFWRPSIKLWEGHHHNMAGQDMKRKGAIVEKYLLEEAREVKSRER